MRQAHPVRARARRRQLAAAALLGAVGAIWSLSAVAGRAPSSSSALPPEAFRQVVAAPRMDVEATPSGQDAPTSAAPSLALGVLGIPTVPTVDAVAVVPAVGSAGATPDPTAIPSAAPALGQPTATPTPVAPADAPPPGPTHVVRPGDSLWTIAVMHGVPLATVVRWNPAVDPASVRIGSKVLVPGGRTAKAATARPKAAPKPAPKQAPKPVVVPRASGHQWPLAVRGEVTTTFSSRHPGIDIAAPAGTPIRAVAAGVVIWAGWKDNGGGFVVVLRHPNGMISTYNHSRRVLVSVGQRVGDGQEIAEVGTTGNSTGPHLDVRIEMGGRLVNPLLLF